MIKLNQLGIVTDRVLIKEYFRACLTYGSLFITSDVSLKVKVVSELKHVNEEQEELAVIPLDDELLNFAIEEEVVIVNEANNISFRAKVLKNHASKWITLTMPDSIRVVNLRECKRYIPTQNLSQVNQITSYGEDGQRKKSQYDGSIIDISSSGAAFKVKIRRMDGLYRGDKVELNISESISSLSRVKGCVVHKSIANLSDSEARFIKIGIKFDKHQVIDQLYEAEAPVI